MSGWTCAHRCRTTASYGRKFVDTMARPLAWAMAHFTISSGALERNSELALEICSAVIGSMAGSVHGDRLVGGGRMFLQDHALAEVAETFAVKAVLRETDEQR